MGTHTGTKIGSSGCVNSMLQENVNHDVAEGKKKFIGCICVANIVLCGACVATQACEQGHVKLVCHDMP